MRGTASDVVISHTQEWWRQRGSACASGGHGRHFVLARRLTGWSCAPNFGEVLRTVVPLVPEYLWSCGHMRVSALSATRPGTYELPSMARARRMRVQVSRSRLMDALATSLCGSPSVHWDQHGGQCDGPQLRACQIGTRVQAGWCTFGRDGYGAYFGVICDWSQIEAGGAAQSGLVAVAQSSWMFL